VTRSPSRNRSDCWRQRLRHAGWHTTCWPQGSCQSPVQRTKHRTIRKDIEYRVEARIDEHSEGRSAEATDARRDVQPPEWSRTNQRRRQGLRPGTFAPEAASTHEHKCSSRSAFVSLFCDHQRRTRRQSSVLRTIRHPQCCQTLLFPDEYSTCVNSHVSTNDGSHGFCGVFVWFTLDDVAGCS